MLVIYFFIYLILQDDSHVVAASDGGRFKLFDITDLSTFLVVKPTHEDITWLEFIEKDNIIVAGISSDNSIFVKLKITIIHKDLKFKYN